MINKKYFKIDLVVRDVLVITPREEIGSHTVQFILDEVDLACNRLPKLKGIVLNLRKVNFVDSIALGYLVAAANKIMKKRKKFIIADARGRVEKLLNTTGMSYILPIVRNKNEALKLF